MRIMIIIMMKTINNTHMNIEDRKTKIVTVGNYMFRLVKLNKEQRWERIKYHIELPCFMGYQGWALHSMM